MGTVILLILCFFIKNTAPQSIKVPTIKISTDKIRKKKSYSYYYQQIIGHFLTLFSHIGVKIMTKYTLLYRKCLFFLFCAK